ncbi:ABC transporter, solute-binding protein [Enterococcus aquimarinus]|uniref:ABC transporter, solute-binding protein n=2 Tax=Enterococcus aquimarinus TaxID=328396 RepID=A0A1L8QSP0_9ENTE|nr:extracellular solute-binding protein [Enterococcus aquimarinus]OJG10545.1 ABC transporter, solute-binding protein [Enterococcus aquimarinus]
MKMRKKNKVILGLGIALFSTILVACGSGNATGNGVKEGEEVKLNTESQFPIIAEGEELSLSIMAPGMGEAEWEDMATLQDYMEKTGITTTYVTPPNADFPTKLNLAFASGDLTDIIYGAGSNTLTSAMEIDYGSQGILVALEDYITPEIMPNLSKMIEEDPNILKSITTPDGHVYSLPMIPRNGTSIWYQGPLWYNGEWLDTLGVEELPKTTEEFYDLLVRFRDEDPNGNGQKDEIPLSDVQMNGSRLWLMGAFGMKVKGIQEDDGVVSYTPISENYKAFLEYMNKLYSEGLLDKEVYSQSDDQKKAKGQKNQLGIFPDYYSFFTTGRSEQEATNDPMLQPLSSEYSPETVIPGSPRLSRGAFSITSQNPSVEASLRWVDYFYSAEGSKYLEQGPEGVYWETAKNKDGEEVRVYTPEVDVNDTESFRAKITPAYGLVTPNLVIDQEPIRVSADEEPNTSFTDWVIGETQEKMEPVAEVPFPLLYLTKEENDKVSTSATDLQTYTTEMEAKFITGVTSFDEWDKYVETIESMGVEEYVAAYQAAYDRWAAN